VNPDKRSVTAAPNRANTRFDVESRISQGYSSAAADRMQ
jgi:hypothetical protein